MTWYLITQNYLKNVHGDVIKWKHFPRYWPFVWVIHRWPVNSPTKGQYCRLWDFFDVKQIVEWPVIWDYMTFIWRHRNGNSWLYVIWQWKFINVWTIWIHNTLMKCLLWSEGQFPSGKSSSTTYTLWSQSFKSDGAKIWNLLLVPYKIEVSFHTFKNIINSSYNRPCEKEIPQWPVNSLPKEPAMRKAFHSVTMVLFDSSPPSWYRKEWVVFQTDETWYSISISRPICCRDNQRKE